MKNTFFLIFIFFLFSRALFAQTAAFTADHFSGCAPLSVVFTDQSTGGASSWNWTFGDAGTSNIQNPSHVYSFPGTYTVTLIINGGSTATHQIIVHASPTASFSLSDTNLCIGTTLTITNNSLPDEGVIDTIIWGFGDGGFDTTGMQATITHSYSDTGTYAISFVVINSFGCSSVASSQIVHVKGPLARFTCSPSASCQNNTSVSFTNNTLNATTGTAYSWNFGDGNISSLPDPSHVFGPYNNYTVVLTATDGICASTDTFIFVQQLFNLVITSSDTICIGDTARFSDITSIPTPATHHWDFGDGLSVTDTSTRATAGYLYTNTGFYTVTLTDTVNNTCNKRVTKNIYVKALPIISFAENDTNLCKVPSTVSFFPQTSDPIKTWYWDFNDPGPADTSTLINPQHTFTQFGDYTIRLTVTDSSGCSKSAINYVHIHPPIASYATNNDSGCVGDIFTFTSTSSSIDSIVSFKWNFGDGSGDTLGSGTINHVYSSTGFYTVKLVITTLEGCTDSITVSHRISIGIKPIANFSFDRDTICFGDTVHFQDLSQPDTSITGWYWSFGDGGFAYTQNPFHIYNLDTGTFTVRLIAYNNGCPDTLDSFMIITVHPPMPLFTFRYNCTNPDSVVFYNQSKGADSIVWFWGDASFPDTTQRDTLYHIFPARGAYQVRLTAWNFTYGCSYTYSALITIVHPIAVIHQDTTIKCYPAIIYFNGLNSQDWNSFSWNFGDPPSGFNNTSAWANPNHLFNSPGYDTVTLVITDLHGCTDTATSVVHPEGPLADFMVDRRTGCTPLTVLFTDNTDTINGSKVVQWKWYFNYPKNPPDTITTLSSSISHTFDSTSSYNILLTVIDYQGCRDTVLKNNYIHSTFPVPTLNVDTFVCPNYLISDTVIAGIQTYPKFSVTWNFGDGTGDFTINNDSVLSHTYILNDTILPLTVIVTDSNTCSDTLRKNIYVFKPVANFQVIDTIIQLCGYTQLTLKSNDSNYIYQWNFSVNGPRGLVQHNSNLQIDTFQAFLNYPGQWNATLIVTNPGCTDTITQPLYFVPGPSGYFTFSPDSGCSPLTVTFHVDSAQNATYIWYDYGNGVVETRPLTDTVVTYTYYSAPGSYTPHIYLGNQAYNTPNCKVPLVNMNANGDTLVKITSPFSINVTQDSILILEGNKDTLTAAPYNSTWIYTWRVLPDSSTLPTTGLPTNGIYTAKDGDKAIALIVQDQMGCQAYDTVYIIFVPCESDLHIPNVFTPNGDEKNDTYYIKNLCPIPDFKITIYNRWGNVVYESKEYNFHWNGTDDNGKDCSPGVYYYIIHGKKKSLYGYIHLIRDK